MHLPAVTAGPPRSVVVVGAGLAGAQTVTALRHQGFTGHVTLLGAEGVEPYDRPPLSKELLARGEPAWLRDELGTDLGQVDDLRLAEPATGLTIDDDVVVTTTTGHVRADAAVLATGSAARRPWPHALTLHSAADAHELRTHVVPGARLVIIGAGWIGAEVAGIAARAGAEVTVVEAGTSPLGGALGSEVGRLTVPWYATAGVRLLLGRSVADVRPDAVHLADGEVLPADVVLAAVGARPASSWLGDAVPVGPDGLVTVDVHHRVLAPSGHLARVVAVGDLARRASPRHGWVTGGHWDGALRGPAVAVRALLDPPGEGVLHAGADPAPYVFSTQLGHELACYGQPGPGQDVVLRGDPAGAFTAVWFTAGGDEVTAVLAVDRPRDVAAARRLFAGRTLPRLDRSRVADPAVPLRPTP